MSEPTPNTEVVGPSSGRLQGVAVVRDAQGNIKGSFEFGADATTEQYEELKREFPSDSQA